MCQFNKDCYRPQRSWGKVIFSEACVKNSVHGGGCRAYVAAGGMHGKGACMAGGACVAGGHVWQILRYTVNEQLLRILLDCILVTGRNEVVAKVIFLHLSVILFTGGGRGSASVHTGIPAPSGADTTPPPPGSDTPPGADTTTSPDQADTPQVQTPLQEQTPPPRSRHHHPPGSRLQQTVYERPVRILLDCILVNTCEGYGVVLLV